MLASQFIMQQPSVVRKLLETASLNLSTLVPTLHPHEIILIGTGSSMNAVLAAKMSFVEVCEKVSVYSPMEFLKFKHLHEFGNDVLVIIISQSGESLDTVEVAQYLASKHAYTLAVTAIADSPVARLCTETALIPAEDELIGPKTKGYVATLVTLQLIAIVLQQEELQVDGYAVERNLDDFTVEAKDWAKYHAASLSKADVVLVVGQGRQYGTAQEGSLKIAEMSGVPCFGLETEEASHGRFHGLTKNSHVIFICSTKKELSFANRLKNALFQFSINSLTINLSEVVSDDTTTLQWHRVHANVPIDTVAGVIPFQFLAIAMAEKLGIKPEKMRYPTLGKYLGIKVSTAL